jgi:hypothetical protein
MQKAFATYKPVEIVGINLRGQCVQILRGALTIKESRKAITL